MPVQFFTEAERARLNRFPATLDNSDLIAFFTLSEAEGEWIPVQSSPANRLGFALQLCTLRFMGFIPEDLLNPPPTMVEFVARQLGVDPGVLAEYGARAQTRSDHLQVIQGHLGYRKAGPADLEVLAAWLVERALEHDKPLLLYSLACERLRAEKMIRPGVTRLERLVAEARQDAQVATLQYLEPILTTACRAFLDSLLSHDPAVNGVPLSWLRRPVAANSPQAIRRNLEKLDYLRAWRVETWELHGLHPNRLQRLAQIARRSSAQALQRAPAERRYPLLVAFLYQSLVDITDDVIEMVDRCLGYAYAHAKADLAVFRSTVARAINEKITLFQELARTVLDPQVSDPELREVIFARIPAAALERALAEAQQISRPLDDNPFDFLEHRYSHLRQFTPRWLATFTFHSNEEADALVAAVELLRQLNAQNRRVLPKEAPLGFVPPAWRPYAIDEPNPARRRHYYELCVLWELRGALRSGAIWLAPSRRYANPETYLIPKTDWPQWRTEVCRQLQVAEEHGVRLDERAAALVTLLNRVDQGFSHNSKVRLVKGDLVITPLAAEDRPDSAKQLEQLIDARLPHVELSELLIEVDSWTGFSRCFEHAGGNPSRSSALLRHHYASVVAQGCNLGLTKMAQIADLSYDQLAWCTTWYLREETLKAAITAIVNFHYHQPLSHCWGGGTLSSSDGQRFPVAGKVRNATPLPRYFGYGRGVTFYTWTSDQFSQYGTQVIPATVRDATYVLDEILDNETELSLVEHTTDTAGYTELVFALFDLLGMQFSPRIRDIGDQRLYRFERTPDYPNLASRLKGTLNRTLLLDHWDDLLRVAGSLKLGWVTASLLIGKLQTYPRKNKLTRALQEYGRLIKTIFILRYLENEDLRRHINTQLNKGEALHALRGFLFFANNSTIRKKQEEAQINQASCLNLLTNAVVAWNTVYMAAAIDQLRQEGYPVQEEDIVHLSPARYEHINPYGRYSFEINQELAPNRLRPLRRT